MIKTVLSIDGMTCPMCESHVNDAIRNHLNIKKVKSNFKKGKTDIISETSLNEEVIRQALNPIGYRILSIHEEPYIKRRLFFKR